MLCPRCGTNYVVSGYCQTCLRQLNPAPRMVLPEELPRAPTPSPLARLADWLGAGIATRSRSAADGWRRLCGSVGLRPGEPALSSRQVWLVIASAIPGLGLVLTGETRKGIGYFFGALLCLVLGMATGIFILSLVCSSGFLTLAYWGALRAVRPKTAVTRAQARGQMTMVLLILCLIYLSAYALLGRIYSPMELNFSIPGTPFRNGDRIVIATYGKPRAGEWVYLERNARMRFDELGRISPVSLANSPLLSYDPATMKPEDVDGRVVLRYAPLPRFGRIP